MKYGQFQSNLIPIKQNKHIKLSSIQIFIKKLDFSLKIMYTFIKVPK